MLKSDWFTFTIRLFFDKKRNFPHLLFDNYFDKSFHEDSRINVIEADKWKRLKKKRKYFKKPKNNAKSWI